MVRVSLPSLSRALATKLVADIDVIRGYHQHYVFCSLAAPKGMSDKFELDDLDRKGYAVHRVLDPDYAASWAKRIKDDGGTINTKKLDPRLVLELLNQVFRRKFYDVLTKYFKTDFCAIFFSFNMIKPLKNGKGILGYSARWHCDAAPTKHLKVLIYLNPSSEHNSATDVICRSDTDMFSRVGYGLVPMKYRLPDLLPLSKRYDIGFTAERLTPDIGEAVVFEPGSVLHKGVYPTRGVRHILMIGLIPWDVHWETFYKENPMVLLGNKGAYFPSLRPGDDVDVVEMLKDMLKAPCRG